MVRSLRQQVNWITSLRTICLFRAINTCLLAYHLLYLRLCLRLSQLIRLFNCLAFHQDHLSTFNIPTGTNAPPITSGLRSLLVADPLMLLQLPRKTKLSSDLKSSNLSSRNSFSTRVLLGLLNSPTCHYLMAFGLFHFPPLFCKVMFYLETYRARFEFGFRWQCSSRLRTSLATI